MRSSSLFYILISFLILVFSSAVSSSGAGGDGVSVSSEIQRPVISRTIPNEEEKDLGNRYKIINWNDLKVNDHRGGRERLKPRDDLMDSDGDRIIVVDKNGAGDSLTVQGAVDMVPDYNTRRIKINILPGIYREKVHISITKPYISFIGNGSRASDTVITWNDKASDKDSDGIELGTFRTPSVAIEADYFCASGVTFENDVRSKPGDVGRQAVALRIAGDKAVFYNVKFIGYQDTLLDEMGTHYFYQCHIEGAVDFIFGRARSLYEKCVITSTAEQFGAIAAHRRDTPDMNTGFSFVRCRIRGSGKVLLGRAWGTYSRTIYSDCYIENVIAPEGWSDWDIPSRQKTAVFGEYRCWGKGANNRGRVPWAKNFNYDEVKPFLDRKFIDGEQWLNL